MIKTLITLADALDSLHETRAAATIDSILILAAQDSDGSDDWDEIPTKPDVEPLQSLPTLDLASFKKFPTSPSEIIGQLKEIFTSHHNPLKWSPQIKTIVKSRITLLHQFL